ncbi:hypothetical protein ACFSFY_00145 [Sporosarcina siberiensis]|uniref:Uncharacterized protein n=1 Tax=Sporosarcina siberiensis TaxID=1365606 RepID=A0ABW4SAJ5_9BACL
MNKKRKNLKLNLSNMYICLAAIFILGFMFFGTSKLFIAEEIPINQTELNTEFDLRANGKFSINSWVYDEKLNLMEVILVTNGMKDFSNKLDFTSVSKKNLKQEMPVKVVFNDNEIYILHINKVPKKFEQVAIRLHKSEKDMLDVFVEDNENENEKIVSTVYADERKVERGSIEKKDNRSYLVQVTENLIDKTKEQKEEIIQRIEIIDSFIEDLNEEIKTLKKDLLYQTMDEQIETNNMIYRLERDVEMKKKDAENLQQDIKNMDSKVERLNQKKRDVSY